MDGRLSCQTDVTPDAHALYARGADDCYDCQHPAELPLEIDLDQAPIISLVSGALALGRRADARPATPRTSLLDDGADAAAVVDAQDRVRK